MAKQWEGGKNYPQGGEGFQVRGYDSFSRLNQKRAWERDPKNEEPKEKGELDEARNNLTRRDTGRETNPRR